MTLNMIAASVVFAGMIGTAIAMCSGRVTITRALELGVVWMMIGGLCLYVLTAPRCGAGMHTVISNGDWECSP